MSPVKQRKTLAPIDAKTETEVCDLQTDNCCGKRYWMMTDGITISIVCQIRGHESTASIDVPKRTFDRFVRWYLKPQEVRKNNPLRK